jgi:hypothetical protein
LLKGSLRATLSPVFRMCSFKLEFSTPAITVYLLGDFRPEHSDMAHYKQWPPTSLVCLGLIFVSPTSQNCSWSSGCNGHNSLMMLFK